MDKLQIVFFFITGFFVSRLIIKAELPRMLVSYLLDKKHSSVVKIIFYLVFLSSLLSFFIPNVITVLTMLPVITTIIEAYKKNGIKKSSLPTMFTLAVMYGANIGGMGSITATPANGILVSFLELNKLPISSNISFAMWLVWGIPLVIVFSLAAWLTIVVVFKSWKLDEEHESVQLNIQSKDRPHVTLTLILTSIYFLSSIGFSIWQLHYPNQLFTILTSAGIFTLLFVVFIFFVPIKHSQNIPAYPLLKIKDCFSNLPIKGFVFVGISIAVAAVLYVFNLQDPFAEFVKDIIPQGLPAFVILIILAILTSFSTELLSNTAVQISLFVILVPLANLVGFSATEALLVVTLSSTCAFMSPIATGVNGLAFGGIKNVSLKMMLLSGFVVNLIGALLISFWIRYVFNWLA